MFSLCSPRPATVVLTNAFASFSSDPANPVPYRDQPVTPIIPSRRGRDGWYRRWLEGDDLESESFFAGVAGRGPSLGRETSA
jgi:hypothetical protein